MTRQLAKAIRQTITKRKNVEKIRFKRGEIHAYGQMPNSIVRGWWLVGYVQDVEIKGIDCLL